MNIGILVGLLTLCGLSDRPASCLCVPGPALTDRKVVRDAAKRYRAIFEGVIVKGEHFRSESPTPKGEFPRDEIVATVAVVQRWRGPDRDTVVVRTPLQTTACGLELVVGERYLLFAEEVERSLYVFKCGLSRRGDAEAQRVKQLLGRGKAVSSSGSR